MPVTVNIGNLNVQVTAEPLTQDAFSSFGDVINNPRSNVHPTAYESHAKSMPTNAISANQGTAIQYRDVSRIKNIYGKAPSGKSTPKMSMFSCAARKLDPGRSNSLEGSLNIGILERHPFTTQTFTPVSSSASRYLVVVAPSLPPSAKDDGLPVPTGDGLPGRGLPDIRRLKAFVAEGNQAVTYGAGTWHAPMLVLGEEATKLDFVVFQFASGEGIEDCQLVYFESPGSETPQIKVLIQSQNPRAKL